MPIAADIINSIRFVFIADNDFYFDVIADKLLKVTHRTAFKKR